MNAPRHQQVAARFSAVVDRVDDWAAPTPVPQWVARDVVLHLVTWSEGFLAAGGISLERSVDRADPAATWNAHTAEIQALLDAPSAGTDFTHPYVGTASLGDTIDRFYSTDVLMHTWDLAESARLPSGLDPVECAALLDGMRPMEQQLRESGQYGPAVPTSADADAVEQLMAFVGRDPAWHTTA